MLAVVQDGTIMGVPVFWFVVGLVGQTMFFGRFLLQWIMSERARKSIVPMGFWYLSIVGGLITLSYAIFREDPIFILGQATGTIVYARNIYFRKLDNEGATS